MNKITLNSYPAIINLLHDLVAKQKIDCMTDSNGIVSFQAKPGIDLAKEFIVTPEGHTIRMDEALANKGNDDLLCMPFYFLDKDGAAIPLESVEKDAENLLYNEVLADVLLSVRYHPSDSLLSMKLPSDNQNYPNEEIIVVRGHTRDTVCESISDFDIDASLQHNYLLNTAVQEIADFKRTQKQLYCAEVCSYEPTTQAEVDRMQQLMAAVMQEKINLKRMIDIRLDTVTHLEKQLLEEKKAHENSYAKLPLNYINKAKGGQTPDYATAVQLLNIATKRKRNAKVDVAISTVACAIGVGFPMLLVSGVNLGIKNAQYKNAKRNVAQSLTYENTHVKTPDIETKINQIHAEIALYQSRLDAEVVVTRTNNCITSSSAFYSPKNPARPTPANPSRSMIADVTAKENYRNQLSVYTRR